MNLRFVILAAAAFLSVVGPAQAAGPPADVGHEIMVRAPNVLEDYASAVIAENQRRHTRIRVQASARPWDDLGAFCSLPRMQRAERAGEFMATNVELPPGRDLSSAVRVMGEVQGHLDRQLYAIEERLPVAGHAVFLAEGRTLRARSGTWGEAVAARGEWGLVLHEIAGDVRQASVGTLDFRANYTAAVWTAIECDLIARHTPFLTEFEASGVTLTDERQLRGLAFLRGFRGAAAP